MSRDHRKLRVFLAADRLAVSVFEATRDFPSHERFGLGLQLRRAATSVACNIVEGSARSGGREFVHFLNIACGSAAEARYLVGFASRVGCLTTDRAEPLVAEYTVLAAQLQTLMRSLRGPER